MPKQILADSGTGDLGTTTQVVGKTVVKGVAKTVYGTKSASGVDAATPLGQWTYDDVAGLEIVIKKYETIPEQLRDMARLYITKRARQLGMTDKLPKEWNVTQEDEPKGLLTLEFNPAQAILQEATPGDPSSVMRVRVPFYIPNSVAQAPGFNLPLFFPATTLPGIVQEAQAQITEGKQPLTVYARHAHALDPGHLPIGKVAGVMQEQGAGYAVLEISSAGLGGTVQQLIRDGMLNAVSLRSRGDFELERVKVNGDLMLEARKLPLAGIDFAPEGPAQPTFGVTVLQEAPTVESAAPEAATPSKEESPRMEITLEAVRAQASIVSEIEKPLRDELEVANATITSITQERDEATAKLVALEAEKALEVARKEIKGFVKDAVAKLPEKGRDGAKAILMEAVKECKSVEEAKVVAAPILLDVATGIASHVPSKSEKDEESAEMLPAEKILLEMFGPAKGRVITQEALETASASAVMTPETVWGLEVPA